RHARADALQKRLPDRQRIQGAHHLSEMAHARQNDLGRRAQAFGIPDQCVLRAQLAQRILHRPQVARAVIEDRNHRSPLVEGSWSFKRASLEQAYFMARAKHLKTASILLWLERPYITLACRVA